MRRLAGERGFTLIEVMVALAIVALGLSALLETLSMSAGNVAALRDKTVAEWIALNKIADARLASTAPTLGTTEGNIDYCAGGSWHWRQDVNAVSAIPGLVNITVSVRRTGNAAPRPSSSNTPAQGHLVTPSALGATGPLGSQSVIGAAGCIAAVEPSLGGTPTLGAPATLGGPSTLGGASPQLGTSAPAPSSLGITGPLGSATGANSAANANGLTGSTGANANGSASANGSSSTPSSSATPGGGNWLVSLTGFRGNSLGAPSGETPNWAGSTLPNAPSPPGLANPNGTNNPKGTNNSNNGVGGNGGNSSNGGIGSPLGPSLNTMPPGAQPPAGQPQGLQ